jgi:putative sugar O-methyltransferase
MSSDFYKSICLSFEKCITQIESNSELLRNYSSHSVSSRLLALEKDELLDIKNLKNFRLKRKLSYGIDDQHFFYKFEGGKRKIINEIVDDIGKKFILNHVDGKNVGNCSKVINLNSKVVVDYHELVVLKWWKDIFKLIGSSSIDNGIVFEIGGGYGALAKFILRDVKCKYFLIDLPQANVLTSYHLNESFDDLKILLYSDLENNTLTQEQIDNNDVFILPPWIEYPSNFKINFMINTRSMMEMTRDVVKKYFDFIHKHIRIGGYFLNINRYQNGWQPHGPDDCSIIWEYPYDKNWQVIYSKPAYRQSKLHMILAQRDKNLSNVKDVLTHLKSRHLLPTEQQNPDDGHHLKILHPFIKASRKNGPDGFVKSDLDKEFEKTYKFENFNKYVRDNIDEICEELNSRWLLSILESYVDESKDEVEGLMALTLYSIMRMAQTSASMLLLNEYYETGYDGGDVSIKDGPYPFVKVEHGFTTLWDGLPLRHGPDNVFKYMYVRLKDKIGSHEVFGKIQKTLFLRALNHPGNPLHNNANLVELKEIFNETK